MENDRMGRTPEPEPEEARIQALHREVAELESRVAELKAEAEKASARIDGALYRQIEILAVFVAVLALVVTNLIGIDALGSVGLRGIAKIDLVFVLTAVVLLVALRLIVTGSPRNRK